MKIVIMEQMVPEDHFLRKADRVVDFSNCVPLYCADNGRPAIATRKGPAKPGGGQRMDFIAADTALWIENAT